MSNDDDNCKLSLFTYKAIPDYINKQDFNSDDPLKADYFFHKCLEWQERNFIHKARFLIDTNQKKIAAFITLHLARFQIRVNNETIYCPYLWISNFAIDVSFKAKGYEKYLLAYIHQIGKRISRLAGCRFILIEVQKNLERKYLDISLVECLEKYGFQKFPFEIKKEKVERKFRKKIILEKMIFDLCEKWVFE